MDIRHCIIRVGVGSGVLVQGKNDARYILTCTHVLGEDWQNVSVAFCDDDGLFSIQTSTAIATDPAPISAEDIALLQCPPEIPSLYQAVKLLHSKHGRELPAFTFGFPANFAEHGRDDRCRIDKLSVKNDRGYELLKLSESQALKGGFSGGPLLDARAQHCLGILSDLERPDKEHKGTLTYAVPAEVIGAVFAEFLELQELSPYLARLRGMYQKVVLNDDKGMTLADIYVEPFYGVHRYCFKEKDKRIEEDKDKPFVNLNTSLHLDLLSLLNQEDCLDLDGKKPGLVLLLGYPGQGKTSFCKRLIYDLTGASSLTFEHIYFVRLRNVANPADLANNALKVIQSEIEDEVDAPPINWNNSLLILDGLDELNIKEGFQGGKIDDICKSLEQACEKYPGLRIVLSSRFGYVDLDALKKRNIIMLRLEEFSIDQQKDWLEKYRAERFHPESPLSHEKLEEYHKHTSIQELLGQAILLHMIASLEEDASGKPNRAAIYDSLFTQLVNRTWSDQGQISLLRDIDLDKKKLRYALQDIAHAIFMSGKGYLRRADLEKLPKVKIIQDKLKQNNRDVDLWRTVMIAAYLDEKKKLREDLDGEDKAAYGIEFLHKSLSEYLCAEKMWRDIRIGFLSKNWDNDWSLNEGKEALKLADTIFSVKAISQEVHDYLVEIIANYTIGKDKALLIERMMLFLTYCIERHFLFNFDSNEDKHPFEKAIATFRGYWTILSNLGAKRNLLDSNNKVIENLVDLINSRPFLKVFTENFNLSYQNLSRANLEGVRLTNADLSYANFSFANLGYSDFCNSDLTHAIFTDAILYQTNLSETNLSGSDLSNAFLTNSNLFNANLFMANLTNASLNHTNLSMATLVRSEVANADLSESNLTEANLSRSNLNGANLSGSNLSEANLVEANLSEANLTMANLNGADLTGANLSEANLSGAEVSVRQLIKCKSLYNIEGLPKQSTQTILNLDPSLFDPSYF